MDVTHQECHRKNLEPKQNKFVILHHNVQSLSNKQLELTVLLNSSLQNLDALCFTEHWLIKDQINRVEMSKFQLGNRFCRKEAKNRGSCIFITEQLNTKEVTYLKDMCAEKD
jgi:hypothetical protein